MLYFAFLTVLFVSAEVIDYDLLDVETFTGKEFRNFSGSHLLNPCELLKSNACTEISRPGATQERLNPSYRNKSSFL